MIAIKDMEMPKSCAECDFRKSDPYSGEVYCSKAIGSNTIIYEKERLKNCPLVEIVTCQDCKYCEEVHYEDEGEPPYVKLKCNSTRNTRFYRVEEDFYCGDGERRE